MCKLVVDSCLIPIFCRTLASCHYANYKPIYVIVNVGIMFILIIAKLPEMHRVRIMGINSSDFKDAPVKIHPVKGSKEQ